MRISSALKVVTRPTLLPLMLALSALLPGTHAFAADESAAGKSAADDQIWTVVDQNGQPLENAVITIDDGVTRPEIPAEAYVMAQEHRKFVPHVLVVPTGADVAFPNRDLTLHQVYSFSPAKTFQLKLYRGDEHAPLVFDHAGLVELGCNIHDRMQAYTVVTDAPFWGKTDSSGTVALPTANIDTSAADLVVWHPRALKKYPAKQHQRTGKSRTLMLAVKSPPKPARRGLGSWKSGRNK